AGSPGRPITRLCRGTSRRTGRIRWPWSRRRSGCPGREGAPRWRPPLRRRAGGRASRPTSTSSWTCGRS
ncbi:unnamed protein product, partial [Prorocentrum cordatum]